MTRWPRDLSSLDLIRQKSEDRKQADIDIVSRLVSEGSPSQLIIHLASNNNILRELSITTVIDTDQRLHGQQHPAPKTATQNNPTPTLSKYNYSGQVPGQVTQ